MPTSAIFIQTEELLAYANRYPPGANIPVDSASLAINAPKRRLYDVLSVLEALQIVSRSQRTFTLEGNVNYRQSTSGTIANQILDLLIASGKRMAPKAIFKTLKCSSNEVRRGYDVLQVLMGCGRLIEDENGQFGVPNQKEGERIEEFVEALLELCCGSDDRSIL